MSEEKEYNILVDGTEMAAALIERYNDSFIGVNPSSVIVMAISNKKPPKSSRRKLAVCKRIDPVTKALLRHFNCPAVRYFIEFYGCDWLEMSTARRHWVLFHELMHIPTPGHDSLVRHTVEDHLPMLETEYGIEWFDHPGLPDLLSGEKMQFNASKIAALRDNP